MNAVLTLTEADVLKAILMFVRQTTDFDAVSATLVLKTREDGDQRDHWTVAICEGANVQVTSKRSSDHSSLAHQMEHGETQAERFGR